ncbi:hypothetical protein D0869_05752 [Hortaea werneckii]|uniref:WSC domain-containing protein n=1 Tax=Hortaea werneckii TaxID=91943 RepID=A0A3M6WWZ3_HORWE|nr:hypothetical protein KC334_g11762 [Hortaea werneckii]KAI6974202.1 hypothetical protein KC355_g11517 [Hortaea werneckii]KAI7658071.1 hypothetical protein KC318_g11454 [Hortaea werneckii]RMX82850.1 hypothetical protein D0869_05752 [Hortaea werneckii]RMX84867.1 hypothetical protein D0868_15417 [Hortaea werneckii]
MPSTFGVTTAYAALSLLTATVTCTHAHAHFHQKLTRSQPAAALEKRLSTMTYEGCYSSSGGLTDQGSYTYQTSGYCQQQCAPDNFAVLGLSGGSNCWCGDALPQSSSKVSDSKCSTPCNGFGEDNCGGDGFFSVYLTGTKDEADVPEYGGGGGSDSSSSSTSSVGSSSTTAVEPSSTTAAAADTSSSSSQTTQTHQPTQATTTQAPIVVTSAAPGTTVVVTQPATQVADASATSSPTEDSKSDGGGGGTNVAGVAAGVVVGVLAAAAIVAGIVLWIRHKKRQQAEEEYKRQNQVSDFMRGSDMREPKPPPTAYSQQSDSRLDPEAGRRNSAGSIADDQDYSRRILRVANPDSS